MDLIDKYLGEEDIDEAMGFVQKLPYQEKKKKDKELKDTGKKRLSAADMALLRQRGKVTGLTTTRDNISKTPKRNEPVNKGKDTKLKKVLQQQETDEKQLVKVGDIFYNSWGYDQTNIDWYQVTKVTPSGKSVKIKRIDGKYKETGFMSGKTTPMKGKFRKGAKELTKRIRVSGDEVNLPMKHGWCPKWDGKEKHSSHYA